MFTMPVGYFGQAVDPIPSLSPLFYSNPAKANSYTNNGGTIDTINDLSGNGNNLSKITTNGPTYSASAINNNPGYVYTHAQIMQSSTGWIPQTDYTVLWMHQMNSSQTSGGGPMSLAHYGGYWFYYGTGDNVMAVANGTDSGTQVGNPQLKDESIPGNPQIIVATYKNSTTTLNQWTNGFQLVQNNVDANYGYAANTYNRYLFQGSFANTNGNFYYGVHGPCAVWNSVLTNSQITTITNYISQLYNVSPYIITCDGDSLTSGYQATNITYAYPYQMALYLTTQNIQHQVWNYGYVGAQITDRDTEAAASIDGLTYLPFAKNILIIWAGTNDINNGASVSTAYSRLKTYVANRLATGKYSEIVVLTAIPRASTTLTNNLFSFNSLITAGIQSGGDLLAAGANNVIDLTQIGSPYNSNTGYNNSTYYNGDLTHQTNLGYQTIGQYIGTQLITQGVI